jgi:hypothetical protein
MEAWQLMQKINHITSKTRPAAGFKERRWAQRTPSEIEVGIKLANGTWQPCNVTSLSLSGMFLNFPAIDLLPDDILVLKFTLDIDGLLKNYFEKVTVKHVNDDGIAVAFENFSNSHFVILQKLLHIAYCQNKQISTYQGFETKAAEPLFSTQH